MDIKEILNDLKPEDFIIRITPYLDDGSWDGDVQVSLVSSEDNPLGEEDFAYVSHLCSMLCATIPVIEEDEYVRDALHSYVNDRFNDDNDDADEPNYTADGNVLTLTSKTRGNA
jgi:hypothetical protein|tara:strand:- start:93 stop:434 length:342 start_codon:yes stop_codon:yes gene_type:complete